MARMTRICSAVFLALMLCLTTAAMAVARAEMSLFGSVTFCHGNTIIAVLLGPDGRPMSDQPICPDCTIGTLANSEPQPTEQLVGKCPRILAASPWHMLHPLLPGLHPSARGPPTGIV